MKILLDNIIFYLQKRGGISVVWKELITRLLRDGYKCSFIEYGKTENIMRNGISIEKNNIINKSSTFLKIKRYFSLTVSSKEKFIFHSSYYRTCRNKAAINITTVHDFTYEYFMKNRGLAYYIHIWQKYKAIRKSDYIICISENTKRDLLKFLPDINPDKICVIYNGVSEDYHKLNLINEELLPFPLHSYLLFVGERGHHKNFIKIAKVISETNYNLVIVGSPLSKKELELFKEVDPLRIKVCTGISNEQLNVLYNGALVFVYPSIYEGFGIPVLEAQKAGCPVIAYKGSSIPEIIGDTPLLLETLNEKEIIQKIDLLHDEKLRAKIVEQGIVNSERFSWENTYKEVRNLYEQISK